MPSTAASVSKPTMGAATAAKYEALCSRSQLKEMELHMRWVESGLEWAEWVDHALAEIDAVEHSIRQADAGLFATQAEVDAAFNKWRR
jgi:predicted transcriptional regulator